MKYLNLLFLILFISFSCEREPINTPILPPPETNFVQEGSIRLNNIQYSFSQASFIIEADKLRYSSNYYKDGIFLLGLRGIELPINATTTLLEPSHIRIACAEDDQIHSTFKSKDSSMVVQTEKLSDTSYHIKADGYVYCFMSDECGLFLNDPLDSVLVNIDIVVSEE